MSFLGSIGKVMECSGISKLFQVVYSSATAVHMMSGKAYARALRAHFLVQSAKKLKDCYSDHLYFVEINGCKNVLCSKNMANYIINEKWYEKDK